MSSRTILRLEVYASPFPADCGGAARGVSPRDLPGPLEPGVDVEAVGELGGEGVAVGEERLEGVVHHPAVAAVGHLEEGAGPEPAAGRDRSPRDAALNDFNQLAVEGAGARQRRGVDTERAKQTIGGAELERTETEGCDLKLVTNQPGSVILSGVCAAKNLIPPTVDGMRSFASLRMTGKRSARYKGLATNS